MWETVTSLLWYQQRTFDPSQWCHTGKSLPQYLLQCCSLRLPHSLLLALSSLLLFSGMEVVVAAASRRWSRTYQRTLNAEDRFRWANK
mgnify:FL=1